MQVQVHVLGEPLLPRMGPFLPDFEGWIQQLSPSSGTQKGHWQDSRDNSRSREKDVIVKVKVLGWRLRNGMPPHQGDNFSTELEGISKVLDPTLVRLVIPLTPKFLLW